MVKIWVFAGGVKQKPEDYYHFLNGCLKLDCHNLTHKKRILQEAVENCLTSLGTIAIPVVIGFAAPELEAWIIADWDQSVQNNV